MMSPELEQAVRERAQLGHAEEQIAEELRTAGYDEATIKLVYSQVNGKAAGMSPVPEPAGALIGYGALISGSFTMVKQEWRMFLVSSLYGLGLLAFLAVVGGISMWQFSSGSEAVGAVFGLVTFLIAFAGFFALAFGLQRALVRRTEQQPFMVHARWALRNFWGLILVSLYIQFAAALGYLLLIIPGIALVIYLSYAMLVRVNDEATGVMALTRSMELIYNRWWGVLFRSIVAFVVFILCSVPLFILALLLWGGVNLASGGATTGLNSFAFPLLFGLIFIAGLLLAGLLMQCAMVLLFESLKASAQPFTEVGRNKLYKWLRVFVIIGCPIWIIWQGFSIYTDTQTTDDFGTLDFGAEEFELSPEEQAEFDAFFEQFGEELGGGGEVAPEAISN